MVITITPFLTSCSYFQSITTIFNNISTGTVNTIPQRIYRDTGIIEALSNWVSIYTVQTNADPIIITTLVDNVRTAYIILQDSKTMYEKGKDPNQNLNLIGSAVLGTLLALESKENLIPQQLNVVNNPAIDIVDTVASLFERLGSAQGLIERTRLQVNILNTEHRDPTKEEWDIKNKELEYSYCNMMTVAHLKTCH